MLIPIIKESEKLFEEKFPPVAIGYDGGLSDQIRLDKFRPFLASSQLALLEGQKKQLEEKKEDTLKTIDSITIMATPDMKAFAKLAIDDFVNPLLRSLEESITYLKSKI